MGICVGAALLVAKEKQYVGKKGKQETSICGPIAAMGGSFKGMPTAFYILLFVQSLVWMGNSVWGTYGKVWFTTSVYPGDAEAAEATMAHKEYVEGAAAFATAGQVGSVFNLGLSFAFMGVAYTKIPHNYIQPVHLHRCNRVFLVRICGPTLAHVGSHLLRPLPRDPHGGAFDSIRHCGSMEQAG